MTVQNYRLPVFSVALVLVLFTILTLTKIVLGPLLFALLFAYLLNPMVEAFERKGVSRSFLVLFGLFSSVVVIALGVWLLLPVLVQQAKQLQEFIPNALIEFEQRIVPKIIQKTKLLPAGIGNSFSSALPTKISDLVSKFTGTSFVSVFENVFQSTKFVFSWILTLLLTPVFTFFVLRDFRGLTLRSLSLVPPDLRVSFVSFLNELDETLRGVLRGQILVVLILSVLYSTAFVLCGLPAALLVGIVTGIARLIPYMDLLVGGCLAAIVMFTNDASQTQVLWVCSAFLIIQAVDALFLTPKIVGQFAGLPPLAIIMAVLCFGDLFGFYGVLVAIPLTAILRVLLDACLSLYKHSNFFQNDVVYVSNLKSESAQLNLESSEKDLLRGEKSH